MMFNSPETLWQRIVARERIAKWKEAESEYMQFGRGWICYDTHVCEHKRPAYLGPALLKVERPVWHSRGNSVCCLCTHGLLCKCRCCGDFYHDADRLSEEMIESPCWVTGEKNLWGQ